MSAKFDGFKSGYKTCSKCGCVRKNYPFFESQWTYVEMDDIGQYICPKCWGIFDPAPMYCYVTHHDWENGVCMRCGKVFEEKK